MNRYIDADKLIELANNTKNKKIDANDIARFPTADVAEVVYCENCKYNAKGDNESEFWNICTLRPRLYVPVSDEDYCSRGEKKDDDRNNS